MKFVYVAVGILAYIAVVLSLTYHPATAPDCWFGNTVCLSPNDMGAFLSGIFAPLAFAWLAWSVVMQSKELALQREELKLTRDEMKEAREVAEDTGKQVKAQADAMKAQTEFFSWQFEEQRLDAKEREIKRLFDSLYALMKTGISGYTILLAHGDDKSVENFPMLSTSSVGKVDDLPSHIALGMLNSDFKSRLNYAQKRIQMRGHSNVELCEVETIDRVEQVLHWILAAETEVRSAVRTDIFSAKIPSYIEMIEAVRALASGLPEKE